LNRSFIRNVGCERRCTAARSINLARDPLNFFLTSRGTDNVRTGRGQDLGNPFTNSAASACHDGCLAL
jgi:hypothetical protein